MNFTNIVIILFLQRETEREKEGGREGGREREGEGASERERDTHTQLVYWPLLLPLICLLENPDCICKQLQMVLC